MIHFYEAGSKQTPAAKSTATSARHGRDRAGGTAKLAGWPAVLLLVVILCASARAAQNTGLSWQGSSDPTVAGYNIYYGGASGNYTNVVSLGQVTNTVISGLSQGVTYYFAATAVDASGVESGFSSEIHYTVTVATTAKLQASTLPGGVFQLAGAGLASHAYEILASTNLVSWTVIGTQTTDANGAFQFTDPEAATFPTRFYRTLDAQQ